MSRLVTVAATQMSCSWDRQANIARAEKLVRQAAAQGAQIILIQELFETPYFCQKPNPEYLQMATPTDENPAIKHFQAIRSEEHTSELQSRPHLVCRLLLEKKKQTPAATITQTYIHP